MPKPAHLTVDWTELTKALSEPFHERDIKYRVGAISRDKTMAQALPFVDSRIYQDRLNALVPGGWHVDLVPWVESRIICRLTIHDVSRSSCGEAGDSPKDCQGTSAEAQSFRRACSKFGLGRYLYALEPRWMPYDAEKKQLIPDARPPKTQRTTPHLHVPQGIGPERAAGMHRALRDAGLPRNGHVAFASDVLLRKVTSLRDITESEARKVWAMARSRGSRN